MHEPKRSLVAPAGELTKEQTEKLYAAQDKERQRIEAQRQENDTDGPSRPTTRDREPAPVTEQSLENARNLEGPSNNATASAALGRVEPTPEELKSLSPDPSTGLAAGTDDDTGTNAGNVDEKDEDESK